MSKTRQELEAMTLGELIRYTVAAGIGFKVMNDLVDKQAVIDAIVEHQEREGGDDR